MLGLARMTCSGVGMACSPMTSHCLCDEPFLPLVIVLHDDRVWSFARRHGNTRYGSECDGEFDVNRQTRRERD
ncbi:uncharacterized protein B0T23DRAFT_384870 [Neurospora hispaniola]|uniref:Uncharacterized protein n=1 Tax=Neurospora hispaniola TaxID=588809 RepID=A0AAJ0MPN7_9PEZI|nr:hypothetical protein B0T23DRAFT_384870 [Neurospora hispaniola]